jgi:ABC-2 type transport system ATP-binding protein
MDDTLLKVDAISKRFGRNWALQDAGFSLRCGEVLGLIGPNGSGKTTLLECVAGLLPADAGNVRFRGQALPPRRRKEALFYLPDGVSPWPELTVRWALQFFESMFCPAQVRLAELLEPLNLGGLVTARIGSLSKGERKRFLVALGLLTPHPFLLLDEPFDGLDLRQTRDVMALLRGHAERGRALMLSIHQLIDAARVCDRLVLLSAGKVVGEGSIPELRVQAHVPDGGLEEIFLALT